MSSGADCYFYEKLPRQWYYDLQRYPYGDTTEYDTYGPFATFHDADRHLMRNHQNPGGFSVQALPGCEHDMSRKLSYISGYGHTHECLRCGTLFKKETA